MSFVPALCMKYEFTNGKLVFEDGTIYDPAEALAMAQDRLEDVDIQAIHLVKRMMGGVIIQVDTPEKRIVVEPDGKQEELELDLTRLTRKPKKKPVDLDALGKSFGDLPLLNKGN